MVAHKDASQSGDGIGPGSAPPVVVFSHLRWNFVFQRPQHVLSRLAKYARVFFIEEPVVTEGGPSTPEPGWEIDHPTKNVTVCRPKTGLKEHGFTATQLDALRDMVPDLLRDHDIVSPVLWFYTPLALPLAEGLSPAAVVYDCMDELSAFLNAPLELLSREAALLDRADVVFTGGPSLYRAKKSRHPNVHCFPSSVDAAHFGQALQEQDDPLDQREISRPRLGYFGVIDERIDLELIDQAAGARPEWQFVMVGPVVKIDPASLPRRTNIHYLGQKTYTELPSYLAGWDVCLLPFARNDATKFISPTKTLEYMAAERPIVSTSITDVAEPYGRIVYLGDTPDEFSAACQRALGAPVAERASRTTAMQSVLASTSWDSTVAGMVEAMREVLEVRQHAKPALNRRPGEKTPVPFQARAAEALKEVAIDKHLLESAEASPPVLIIGAGPTGLSAAYHLGADALLIEQNDRIGGWCRSIKADGFTFDFAGHIMFSNDPYVHELYQLLLGDNVHWQDREAWVFSKSVYTRYPFQGSLYGLPPKVIKECLLGAIECRYGSLKAESNGDGCHKPAANGKPVTDCCADGVMESTAPLTKAAPSSNGSGTHSAQPDTFEDFIYRVWGRGIAEHFAVPYNRKLWAVPLKEMETSWLGGRVPMPDLGDMIEGALTPAAKPMGPNARFGYPLRGGFQALMDAFLPLLKGPLQINTRVKAVSPKNRTVTLSDGSTHPYEVLISTMPLPALIRAMGDEAPAEIQQLVRALRHVSVRCVHIGVARENITEKHWVYYPEETVFHRIFVQGNASPHCNPPGGFGLTCEITYSEYKPLPCEGDALIQRCIDDCRKVGMMASDDKVLTALECDLPYAYVVYDHARAAVVAKVRAWLEDRDILLAGRYSEWEYYNSDHAFLAGRKAAQTAHERLNSEVAAAVSVG